MLDDATFDEFEQIYATDLVYIKDCWKLCGNAHCCGFFPYKENFNVIGKTKFHELPLFPGEYEFLQSKGWWSQFGDADHKVITYPIDHRTLRVETMVSRKPMCACNHDTRLTVCRLYPLLPQFDLNGKLISTRSFGIFEEFEKIEGLDSACKVSSIPFHQMQAFLDLCSCISKSPRRLFYLSAYALAVDHVRDRIVAAKEARGSQTAFTIFEGMLLFRKLVNDDELKPQLIELADLFEDRYGAIFD